MEWRMRWLVSIFVITMGLGAFTPTSAQNNEVPYWASIASPEVRMRVGPSRDFPIEWVYKRDGLPIKVVRVQESWRLVEDPEGTRGWMAASLLSRERTALVIGEGLAAIRDEASDQAGLKWNVEPGVVGKLGVCAGGWCEFDVEGRAGWVPEDRLWGTGAP
jgi:SH3-like domain-containing protein